MAIKTGTNFSVGTNLPIDERFVVETYDELASMNNAYEGLQVYVKEDCKFYVCTESDGTFEFSETKSGGQATATFASEEELKEIIMGGNYSLGDVYRYTGEDTLRAGIIPGTSNYSYNIQADDLIVIIAKFEGEEWSFEGFSTTSCYQKLITNTPTSKTIDVVNEEEANAYLTMSGNNGDTMILRRPIANDKYSYTAYVYESNTWCAMDGNYNAENVYFSEDLMTTTAMGNISLTNGQATISAAGQSLVDVWNTIYVKEDNTELKTSSPSAKLSSTSPTYYEIGKTGSRDITVSLDDDGKYKYGYLPLTSETGSEVAGDTASTIITGDTTGVVVTENTPYELTFNGSAVSPKTTNGATFTLTPTAQTTIKEMKMKGKVNYQQGGIPVSNLKKLYPAQRIAAGYDETDEASAFRWYIPYYTGFIYGTDAIADPSKITASDITSKLSKTTGADAYSKKKITSATATKAWRQYFIAYPKDWSYDMSAAKDGNNIDCTVGHADDVTIDINGTDVIYSVYYINNAADYGTLKISWTLN